MFTRGLIAFFVVLGLSMTSLADHLVYSTRTTITAYGGCAGAYGAGGCGGAQSYGAGGCAGAFGTPLRSMLGSFRARRQARRAAAAAYGGCAGQQAYGGGCAGAYGAGCAGQMQQPSCAGAYGYSQPEIHQGFSEMPESHKAIILIPEESMPEAAPACPDGQCPLSPTKLHISSGFVIW